MHTHRMKNAFKTISVSLLILGGIIVSPSVSNASQIYNEFENTTDTLDFILMQNEITLSKNTIGSEGNIEDPLTAVTDSLDNIDSKERGVLYSYSYKVSSKYSKMSYGKWETTFNRKTSKVNSKGSYTYSRIVSNSISGSVKASVKAIEASLGFKTSGSQKYSFTESFNFKKNKGYKMQLRPRYKTYTITQKYYKKNRITGKSTLVSTYTATTKKKDGIDTKCVVY